MLLNRRAQIVAPRRSFVSVRAVTPAGPPLPARPRPVSAPAPRAVPTENISLIPPAAPAAVPRQVGEAPPLEVHRDQSANSHPATRLPPPKAFVRNETAPQKMNALSETKAPWIKEVPPPAPVLGSQEIQNAVLDEHSDLDEPPRIASAPASYDGPHHEFRRDEASQRAIAVEPGALSVESTIAWPAQLDPRQRSTVRIEVERVARERVPVAARSRSAAPQKIEVRVDQVNVRMDTPAPVRTAAPGLSAGSAFAPFFRSRSLR